MRLKIAIGACLPFPTSQGSQVLTHALAQSLADRGHEVHLVTYAYGESRVEMRYYHHPVGAWVPTKKLRAGPSLWKPALDFAIAKKWLSVAREIKADILHAINYEAVLAGLWVKKRYRAPLVSSIHGILSEELPHYFTFPVAKEMAKKFGPWFTKKVVSRSDAVAVLNPRDAEMMNKLGIQKGKIFWHYPSVEISGDIPDRNKSRADLDWQDKKVILYAGNLDRYQGLEALYSAFRTIVGKHDSIILAVATTSYPKLALKALGDLKDRVQILFTADFEKIKRAIVSCDAFVIPRPVEYGFPIKLLNALTLGAPVVINRACAYGVEDKRDVLVYDDSEQGLVDSLERVLFDQNLSSALASGARLASENFGLKNMVAALEVLYQSMLKKQGVF